MNWVAPLRRKYAEMLRLRRGDQDGSIADPRPAMAALASEFPGALREIDEIPLGELERRVALLERLAASGATPGQDANGAPATEPAGEPWGPLGFRYHELLRGALGAKRWLAGRRSIDEDTRRQLTSEAPRMPHGSDVAAWAGALELLATPPQGRLVRAVLARMAAETSLPIEQIEPHIFGPGHPRRG